MKEFFLKNMFTIMFTLIGLVFIVLILTIGWWALLIIAVTLICFFLGRIKDRNMSIAQFFNDLFKKQ